MILGPTNVQSVKYLGAALCTAECPSCFYRCTQKEGKRFRSGKKNARKVGREVKKREVKLGGRRGHVEKRKKWRWREEGVQSKEDRVTNSTKNRTKVRWKKSAASGEGIIVRKSLDLVTV